MADLLGIKAAVREAFQELYWAGFFNGCCLTLALVFLVLLIREK